MLAPVAIHGKAAKKNAAFEAAKASAVLAVRLR
jgi:hypothetical protein